jgi:hypothetical protein
MGDVNQIANILMGNPPRGGHFTLTLYRRDRMLRSVVIQWKLGPDCVGRARIAEADQEMTLATLGPGTCTIIGEASGLRGELVVTIQ